MRRYTDGYVLAFEYVFQKDISYANYDVCIGVDDEYLSCLKITKNSIEDDDSSFFIESAYWHKTGYETSPIQDGTATVPDDMIL